MPPPKLWAISGRFLRKTAWLGRWRSWARWTRGGGGTVAKYMANRNIETIDAGVPVLSMHAPYETVAKFDCYMTYKAVKALYLD